MTQHWPPQEAEPANGVDTAAPSAAAALLQAFQPERAIDVMSGWYICEIRVRGLCASLTRMPVQQIVPRLLTQPEGPPGPDGPAVDQASAREPPATAGVLRT